MRETSARAVLESDLELGGETEGTLILTNRRLIFVCTGEKAEVILSPEAFDPTARARLFISDVEDFAQIPAGPPNLFIPISSISSVKGRGGEVSRPGLEVKWSGSEGERSLIFTELLTGGRKRNLNDWAPIIENLKAGRQNLVSLPQAPSVDTLEGKIVWVLSDMQEKGVFNIEEDVEDEFKVELDSDDVQAACERLVALGLLKRHPDPSGDVFYRKSSPLGEEDLSS